MQINCMTAIMHQSQKPYCYKYQRSLLPSFLMNWHKFLEPTTDSKGNTKAVLVSAVGTSSEGEEVPLKSQWKCEAKMSTQSSQIRDLHSKLDSVITVEISQMWQFLNPSILWTVVTNVLQTTQPGNCSHSNSNSGSRQGKPFLGRPWEHQLPAGKDGTTDPREDLPLL